jgi:hypothetical protein
MKLHILTIVLDGMPFLPIQFTTFNRLACDWTWHIVEGAAANVHCTSWCRPQPPRLSRDGSHEFIGSLSTHPRVRSIAREWWPGGKVEMCNAGIEGITEPGLLLQVDMDELWSADQIDRIVDLFSRPPRGLSFSAARFFCRYFVGPNLVTLGEECYGNNPGEWLRAWRLAPGARFTQHEPPRFEGADEHLDRETTRGLGLVFDHYAYAFESQVAYKEQFYGYEGAVAHWRRLQANDVWPARLREFLPWVDDRALATSLHAQAGAEPAARVLGSRRVGRLP